MSMSTQAVQPVSFSRLVVALFALTALTTSLSAHAGWFGRSNKKTSPQASQGKAGQGKAGNPEPTSFIDTSEVETMDEVAFTGGWIDVSCHHTLEKGLFSSTVVQTVRFSELYGRFYLPSQEICQKVQNYSNLVKEGFIEKLIFEVDRGMSKRVVHIVVIGKKRQPRREYPDDERLY